jgi:hypothetical protein
MSAIACRKVFTQALSAWRADMELNADHMDRENAVCRKLLGEHLGGRFLQRVRIVLPGTASVGT